MYTVEELLNRLDKGENMNDIANEITDIMNKANKLYLDQEKEKVKEAERHAVKVDAVNKIIEGVIEFISAVEPDLINEDMTFSDEEIDELVKGFEVEVREMSKLTDFMEELQRWTKVPEEEKKGTCGKGVLMTPDSEDKVFANFFRRMGF